jgi:uncharacterized protein (TIGR00297 family)
MENWLVALVLNTVLLGIAYVAPVKVLTPIGLLHAWFLGVITWGILGAPGYAVVFFYLIAGSAVTKLGYARKKALGIAEKRGGARGPANLWGSALTGLVCAFGYLWQPNPLWLVAYVASFSTKLSDTAASEVGKTYGKSTYLITTLKPVPPGTEGAVSLEGTLAGIAASIVISVLGWAIGLISPIGILWCVIAAFIATTIESLLGTVQDQLKLSNEVVNGINTAIGALSAWGLALLFGI